jgi:hypothetical protein
MCALPIAIIPVFQDIANVYQLQNESFLLLLYFKSSIWNVILLKLQLVLLSMHLLLLVTFMPWLGSGAGSHLCS